MNDEDRELARAAMLQQLTEVREQVRRTSAMGANFLLGVATGTLMNLRDLLPHDEFVILVREVKVEFGEVWPDINPAFIALLDKMISHPRKGHTHD